MLKKSWHVLPILTLFVVTFILGSFFDLSINQHLFDRYNNFGTFMAAFSEAPFYMSLGIISYGFFYSVKGFDKKIHKILIIALGIIVILASSYFQGGHVFDVNAYNKESLMVLGYFIGLIITLIGVLLGYLLLRNTSTSFKRIFFICLILGLMSIISIGLNQLVKAIMSRPRYRFLEAENIIDQYRSWWESGKDLKEIYVNKPWTSLPGIIKSEEFKSFPSGHMNDIMCFVPILASLHLLNNKFKVNQFLLIMISLLWALLTGFSRMLIGAHYLSDISMGAIITVICWFIANKIYLEVQKHVK